MELFERDFRTRIITDCHSWTGPRSKSGYGKVMRDGKTLRAHRVAYEMWVGPIPEGMEIDHLCRNRLCVNPEHLEAVTPEVNQSRRKWVRDCCANGHPWTEKDTYWYTAKDGRQARQCRECNRQRCRRRYHKDERYRWKARQAAAKAYALKKPVAKVVV